MQVTLIHRRSLAAKCKSQHAATYYISKFFIPIFHPENYDTLKLSAEEENKFGFLNVLFRNLKDARSIETKCSSHQNVRCKWFLADGR